MLVLARLAETRAAAGRFAPKLIDDLFDALGLPRPPNTRAALASLSNAELVARLRAPGSWRLTPAGRAKSIELIDEMNLAALVAEASLMGGPDFGRAVHPVIPPTFAPPGLLGPLRAFLADHPFDNNVFGMTRFPEDDRNPRPDGPLASALGVARTACADHGLEFHLASDRAIADDLWTNVTAHMWASRYGIAFFEDRRGAGINVNLTIEVGAMLVTGRRLALLRDKSIARMPTNLVGKIYKSVDLDLQDQVSSAIHGWLRDDLALRSCRRCA